MGPISVCRKNETLNVKNKLKNGDETSELSALCLKYKFEAAASSYNDSINQRVFCRIKDTFMECNISIYPHLSSFYVVDNCIENIYIHK